MQPVRQRVPLVVREGQAAVQLLAVCVHPGAPVVLVWCGVGVLNGGCEPMCKYSY